MSKYAIGPNPNKPILVEQPDTLAEIFESPLYSFKYDSQEGKLIVEKVLEDEPVILPSFVEGKTLTNEGYVNWLASSKKMIFKWIENYSKTHLYLEVE